MVPRWPAPTTRTSPCARSAAGRSRALARGIDRAALLAESFGGGTPSLRTAPLAGWDVPMPVPSAAIAPRGGTQHHAVNGPFPAGSWAVCTDERVPANLLNRAAAEAFLKKAAAPLIDLELKYPDDDPQVARACTALAKQLAELGDKAGKTVRLTLVPLPPQQLRRDVLAHKYQLAYWHHDFANDVY